MGLFQGQWTPKTDLHQLDLQWIVEKVQESDAKINSLVTDELSAALAKYFVNIVYDEKTKTIKFNLEKGE